MIVDHLRQADDDQDKKYGIGHDRADIDLERGDKAFGRAAAQDFERDGPWRDGMRHTNDESGDEHLEHYRYTGQYNHKKLYYERSESFRMHSKLLLSLCTTSVENCY